MSKQTMNMSCSGVVTVGQSSGKMFTSTPKFKKAEASQKKNESQNEVKKESGKRKLSFRKSLLNKLGRKSSPEKMEFERSSPEKMEPIKFEGSLLEAKSGIKKSHLKVHLNTTPKTPIKKFRKNSYKMKTPATTNKILQRIKRSNKKNKASSFIVSKNVKNKSSSFSVKSPKRKSRNSSRIMQQKAKDKSFKREPKPLNKFTNKLNKVARRNSILTVFSPVIRDLKNHEDKTSNKVVTEDNKNEESEHLKIELQQMIEKVKELETEKEAWTKKETEFVLENEALKLVIEELNNRNVANGGDIPDVMIPELKETNVDSTIEEINEAEIKISYVDEADTAVISGSMITNRSDKLDEKSFITCSEQDNSQYFEFDDNLSVENDKSFKLEILNDSIGSLKQNRNTENYNEVIEMENFGNDTTENLSVNEWREKAEKLEEELKFMTYIIDSYNIVKIDGIV